jgi:hypothetical protein
MKQGNLFELEEQLYRAAIFHPDLRFKLAVKALDGNKSALSIIHRLETRADSFSELT